jgi:hypothetical protein
MKLTQDQDY